MPPPIPSQGCAPSGGCAIDGQITMLVDGMTELFKKVNAANEALSDLKILGVERAAEVKLVGIKVDALADGQTAAVSTAADQNARLEKLEGVIRDRETIFAITKTMSDWLLRGIGAAVVLVVVGGVVWLIKKVFGVDLGPFLHLAEGGH